MNEPSVRLPIRRHLRDPVDEVGIRRIWHGIEERSAQRRRVQPWILVAAGAAILLAGLFVGFVQRPPQSSKVEHAALTLRDGAPIPSVRVPATAAPVNLELVDGSRIDLAPGATLEPLAISDREIVLRLAAGSSSFEMVPGGARRWVVEAGIARVEVVGTRFRVARSTRSVRVSVERGSVLVRARTLPDGVVSLSAGQHVEVSLEPSEPSEPSPPVPAPSASVSATVSASAGSVAPPRGGAQATPAGNWREQARVGKHRDAYDALGAEGLTREIQRAETPDDLFTLADVARLSGHPAQAVAPLERFLARHAGDPRAPLAALTLGRIQLGLGSPGAAAQSLQRALAMGVPGGLVEDVYARLVEAQIKSGQTAAARATADEYAKRFPNGRKAASIEAWFER